MVTKTTQLKQNQALRYERKGVSSDKSYVRRDVRVHTELKVIDEPFRHSGAAHLTCKQEGHPTDLKDTYNHKYDTLTRSVFAHHTHNTWWPRKFSGAGVGLVEPLGAFDTVSPACLQEWRLVRLS